MRTSNEFKKALATAEKKTGRSTTRIVEDLVSSGLPAYVKKHPKKLSV